MRSLVYLATQARPISDTELRQIFGVLGDHYTALQLTGTLVVKETNWFAILEGEHGLVQSVLEQASRDPRLTNLQVIADEEIADRSYTGWSATSDSAAQPASGAELTVPAEPATSAGSASRPAELLAWFRKHPLGPLTGPTAAHGRAARDRAIGGATTTLHDVGVTQFHLELAAVHAGMATTDLAELFPTSEALLAATLDQWIQDTWTPLVPLIAETGPVSFLRALLIANAEHPLLAELQIASFASAADPFADMADYHRSIHRWLQRLISDGLAGDARSRREPPLMSSPFVAEQLLALHDGLRLQTLVAPKNASLDAFDHAISMMRRTTDPPAAHQTTSSSTAASFAPVIQQGQA